MANPKEKDVSVDSHHRDPITLTRFLLQEKKKYPNSIGDFTYLLSSIQLACKVISNACNKAGIANIYGVSGDANSSGDQQKKLDVFSNDCFINCLSASSCVKTMVSEEDEKPIFCKDASNPKYSVVFDPLDGSSNIEANVSIGTIFGIYNTNVEEKASVDDVLKKGNKLVCAGYALYGAATMMVLATDKSVNGFTLDPSLGEFILTHNNITIPKKGLIYSINEGNFNKWDKPTKKFIEWCKHPDHSKKARYIGSMVADVHRTLLYGGIFCYPADVKNKNGKLRLLYECNPMGYIVAKAGGKASTGTGDVLELEPTSIHQRCPIFLGSDDLVDKVDEFYKLDKEGKLN